MKQSELKRWLAQKGATFIEGGNHTKVMLNGKISFLPRHSSEIKKGLAEAVKKQLGLK